MIELTPHEIRVLGCLLEKSVLTPDQYPLTLNSLTTACNQKSSRDPVLSLDPGTVSHAARALEQKHLLSREENFRSGVEKYSHRLCNTPFSEYQFSPEQYAVVCLLLLRGAQTPGELRSRSGRLHRFDDNAEVAATLESLIQMDGGAVVARLPRKPGRQDYEYMHLFGGAIESVAAAPAAVSPSVDRVDRLARIEARLDAMEQALNELQRQLGMNTAS